MFIGPDADVMARMGDKVEAKRELAAAGVPLVPGTEAVGLEEAQSAAAELGYPVMLKATAGGGGKGMRLVESPDELEDVFPERERRGLRGVRRRKPVPRKADHVGPPRRGSGALRRRRRRADARRARVLDPAPAPEADRRVAVAGSRRGDTRGDGDRCRTCVPCDFLPQRGDVRVSARARWHVPLHRAERPLAGRAPGERARDRHRHRPRAVEDRGGRAAAADGSSAPAGARDRGAAERRGSVTGLRACARRHRAPAPAARAGRSGSTRT